MRPCADSSTGRSLAIRSAALLLLFAILLPSLATSEPVLWPATRAGWTEQLLDERDTAPYLAFHKAQAGARLGGFEQSGLRGTANQDAYDARFYDLDLTLNPSAQILSGVVEARVTVTAGPLTTLDLDLDNLMTVSQATMGGSPVAYTHVADILTVQLDRSYATGEEISVVVSYSGNPAPGGAFGWDYVFGRPNPWSLSEPFGGRTWWPSKDWSHDKADSVRIRISAPTGMTTASNGTHVSHTDDGTTAVDVWSEKYPIATYLVSIASYPYSVYSDYYAYSPTDSMEIKFFIYPEDLAGVLDVQAKVKTMIGAFAERFGEYPFLDEKYGHAEFPWGGGMEHQTCTSLGYFGESVVAHELAHQWWGDMVTCKDFHHIWLNEGFATWSEAIWAEHNGGIEAYHQELSFNAYYGPGTIYVPDLNDWNRIFDSNLSYNKASWVVHMLRGVLGDEDFFASLAAYRSAFEYGAATTEEFRDICEGVSGQDLDYYFNQWIYGEYYPQYKFNYAVTQSGGGYDIALTIEQTQSWQIFEMPIRMVVGFEAGEQTFVVHNDQAVQEFVLHVDQAPVSIRLDPDNWILKTVQEPVVDPAFDRGVLLVNGVEWNTYGSELTTAYQDNAFWGDYEIDFWDIFQEPEAGYPSTLPEPIGHGAPPASVIGHYRNVVWVGNNYAGDLSAWLNSPALGYLEAGGNLILMTRQGDSFITEPFRQYLGINWLGSSGTIYDCVATYTGLTNIARLGSQTLCSTFSTLLNHVDSRVIYQAQQNYNPDRGIGVWRKPAGGGIYRPDGAQFVFLSGRPYRWNHVDLRNNIMHILEEFFDEPLVPADVEEGVGAPAALRLDPARPNPAAQGASIRFALPRSGEIRVELLDVQGRRVRTLADGVRTAGVHTLEWDGRDRSGHSVAAGIYWIRMAAENETLTRPITVVR